MATQKMNEIQVQAFWGYLSLRKFADAFELIASTDLDAREVRRRRITPLCVTAHHAGHLVV